MLPRAGSREFDSAVASAIVTLLARHPGDILVFLPGMADIRSVQRRLLAADLPGPPVAVLPLHGTLSPSEQDAALRPQHGALRWHPCCHRITTLRVHSQLI